MWGLQNAQQNRRPHRPKRRDLTEPFPGLLFLALAEQIPPNSLAQYSQCFELLVITFSPPANPRFGDLAEPLGPMTLRIHLLAGTRNSPTTIDGFHSGLHSGQVSGDGQITAHRLL